MQSFIDLYSKWNLSVIPIGLKDKKPTVSWQDFQKSKASKDTIAGWFKNGNRNIGIVCGEISDNLVVLDCDNPDLFIALSDYWIEKYGKKIDEATPVVKTGGGGHHIYIKVANIPRVYHPTGEDRKHIPDIQAEGSYVVAPPSIHPSGNPYKFLNPQVTTIQSIKSLSELAIEVPTTKQTQKPKEPGWVLKALQGVGEGSRDQTCVRLAGYFRSKQPEDITTQILLDFADKCIPPLDRNSVIKCVKSAYKYEDVGNKKDESLKGLSREQVNLICSKGWLRSYIYWASQYTDAPLAFHMATGLSLLATSMGNRIKARAWGRELFPNLWIVIVSPSGFYRKTTAIRLGMRIFKRDLADLVLPSEWSREKLVQLLGSKPAGLFEWDEFGYALTQMQRDYCQGTKEMLTKLFDSSDSHNRVTGQGGISGTIDAPAPNVLGGTTIEWLQARMKEGDLRGGFMSRFLFIPGMEKEPEKDFDKAFRIDLEDELASGLRDISKLSCEVDFAPIKNEIKQWVREHEEGVAEISPEVMGFMARGETYLLKLCMVLGASDSIRIALDTNIFNRAVLLLDGIKEGVKQTAEAMMIPREGKELNRLKEMLKRNCPMTKREALRNAHISAKTFEQLLNTLILTGEVKIINEKSDVGQRKVVVTWAG